tara:strand:- start:1901 stop:2233 length:333 start_codon:yes stop_codon:yes gene_type:complete
MNEARDKIAKILEDKIELFYDFLMGFDEAADAILAALPDMIAPLVWQRNGSHWAGGYGFVIRKVGKSYFLHVKNGFPQDFDLLADAQAKANAHHRSQIMAAFNPTTGEKP